MAHYPFHLIMDTYAHDQDHYFIVCVDYATDSTVLAIYPFTKDMVKLAVCGITINNILSKKAVSALHILSLRYKATSVGVVIIQAEFVIGYRSGQVAVIEYKDKECKIVTKLNKTLKSEGIFSKTSSFFFGDEDTYSVYIKEAVRSFTVNHSYPDLSFSYLIGNEIIFMKNLN